MRKLFTFLCLLLSLAQLQAQDAQSQLNVAVEGYNALKEYINGLEFEDITDEDRSRIAKRKSDGIAKLKDVLNTGDAAQIKAARYFIANFEYQEAFILGASEMYTMCFDGFKRIEHEFSDYRESDFPIRYKYFDKNFIVKWEDFASTQAEFLASMTEISYRIKDYSRTMKYGRLSSQNTNGSKVNRLAAMQYMLRVFEKKSIEATHSEYIKIASQMAKLYFDTDSNMRELMANMKFDPLVDAYKALNASSGDAPDDLKATAAAEVAAGYYREGKRNEAMRLYELARNWGYQGSQSYYEQSLADAANFWQNYAATDNGRAAISDCDSTATQAIEFLTGRTISCGEMRRYAGICDILQRTAEAGNLLVRAKQCDAEEAKQRAREAEENRKAEEKARKETYRREHPFNVFIHLDLVPLMNKNIETWDYCAYLDLRGRHLAHSFGYSLIDDKRDINSSLHRWDGYKASYTFKYFPDYREAYYSGLYFGYADKTFNPLAAQVYNLADGAYLGSFDYTFYDKQYEVMYVAGGQLLGKGFGTEFFFGVGASYNQLSSNYGSQFPTDAYNIISESEFFETRTKPTSWNLKMRMGWTIGLNLGRSR